MRYSEILNERVEPKIYYHATQASNVKSILKTGLIPNKAGLEKNHGRYENGRWWTLEGVYCTHSPVLLSKVLEEFLSPAIVILSISSPSGITDEDAIDNLIQKLWEQTCNDWGIDHSFYYELDYYFEQRKENSEHGDAELIKNRYDLFKHTALIFHQIASKGNTHIIFDEKLIESLIEHWYSFKDETDEEDPFEWKRIKDVISRKYPQLESGDFKNKTSIRIPTAITFRGRNRIIAVVDNKLNVLYGNPPAQSLEMLRTIL